MARSLIATLAHRYGHRPTSAERRAFLKATLASAAGLMLSASPGLAAGRRAVVGSTVWNPSIGGRVGLVRVPGLRELPPVAGHARVLRRLQP